MSDAPSIVADRRITATDTADTSQANTPNDWPRPEPSVGSGEESYDNALAETIDGLYKAEVIHRRGLGRSFEAVEFATME